MGSSTVVPADLPVAGGESHGSEGGCQVPGEAGEIAHGSAYIRSPAEPLMSMWGDAVFRSRRTPRGLEAVVVVYLVVAVLLTWLILELLARLGP